MADKKRQHLSGVFEKLKHSYNMLKEENTVLKNQLQEIKEQDDSKQISQIVRKGDRQQGNSIFDLQIIQNENDILRK